MAVIRGLSTRRFNLKQVAIAAMVGLVSLASWMLPLFYVSGGFPQYWQLAMAWMEGHQGDTDSLRAVIDNLIFLLKTILMGIGVAVFPLLWMLARSRLNLLALLRRSWRSQVLALWIIPGAMYFCFVHLQRQGHSFTIMPAFFVLSGLAIVWTAKRLQNPYAWLILTTTLVSINGLFSWWG